MKHLLSSILIAMAISSASYAAVTKTEIIEERVCHAVAGCWMNPKTGECPDCVIETRKVVTEVEESVVEVKIKLPIKIAKKNSPIKNKNGCWFAEAGWPKGVDENFEPIMSGGYMPCSWRS